MRLFSTLILSAACLFALSEPAAAAPPMSGQAKKGAELYGAHCARCHGPAGQGSAKAPPVVGKDALPLKARAGARRDVEFRTARDVLDYVQRAMPGGKPGSLTAAEYAAILAFDLTANGVDVSKKTIDAESARAIVLHP